MTALGIAFKEWAVICRALAEGRQALILRKGGIGEAGGSFRVEHHRFWLYPTWVHQQDAGIVPEARPLLEQARKDRPPEGGVRLSHFAESPCVYFVDDLERLLRLEGLHLWSNETVEARFTYRRPGLFVLPVRIWRAAEVHELAETPAFAGCKSWVELGRNLSTDGAVPVLSEEDFDAIVNTLDRLLEPTALA
jgi:hypothetical protein